jgi:signal transduction histidine kinase/ActR/RegA family two-component response regulator
MASRGTVIPFRALLFVLVMVAAIPALIFSAVLLERYADSEKMRATIALEESAQGIARAADTLFANAGEVLKVLSNSTRLLDGDLEGFERQIRLVTTGTGRRFDLVSPDGKLIATTIGAESAEARIEALLGLKKNDPDRQLYTSRVLGSPGQLYTQVAVPVKVAGVSGWMLQTIIPAQEFASLLGEPGVPRDWIISLADQDGRILIRAPNNEQFAGQFLVPKLVEQLHRRQTGSFQSVTHEGTPVATAIGYAQNSGWVVAVGLPEATLQAPLDDQLRNLAALGTLLITGAVVLAFLIARRLDRAIETVAIAAKQVGEGKIIEPPHVPIHEIAQLGGTLSQISHELRDRAQRLEDLNRTLEARVADRTGELSAANMQLVAEMKGRQETEAQFRHLQRLEALGQLTGGIAHDFNNILAVMGSCLELISRRLSRGDTNVTALIESGRQSVERAAALTRRLLAFARQQTLSPEPLDANKLLAGIEDMLRRTLPETVKIEMVLGGGLWQSHADVHQLESALLNLAVNARDAMPEGGKLTIETANAHLDEAYATLHPETEPGQYVMIAITDSGTGMTSDVLNRAFDPFFTTKPTGEGTGLGLSQVFGFAKQSAGHVKIYSELGVGTTVKLYLPRLFRADHLTLSKPQINPDAPRLGGSERILIVEDSADVRLLVVAMARELNYDVLDAPTGAVALALLDANPDIKLVLTDVVMPDMNGRQLADEVERRHPHVKVLFTTGYTRNAIVHNGILDPGVNLIAKPFTIEALAEKLHGLLSKPAAEDRPEVTGS